MTGEIYYSINVNYNHILLELIFYTNREKNLKLNKKFLKKYISKNKSIER